jgi:hypothetical protein
VDVVVVDHVIVNVDINIVFVVDELWGHEVTWHVAVPWNISNFLLSQKLGDGKMIRHRYQPQTNKHHCSTFRISTTTPGQVQGTMRLWKQERRWRRRPQQDERSSGRDSSRALQGMFYVLYIYILINFTYEIVLVREQKWQRRHTHNFNWMNGARDVTRLEP